MRPSAWRLVDIEIDKETAAFTFSLNRKNPSTSSGAQDKAP
jgi:hypothetical protein